jgi:hypothetical protein
VGLDLRVYGFMRFGFAPTERLQLAMDPRTKHLFYRVFKRNIGTTVSVALVLSVAGFFISPAVAIGLGIATALLIGWWILFIING